MLGVAAIGLCGSLSPDLAQAQVDGSAPNGHAAVKAKKPRKSAARETPHVHRAEGQQATAAAFAAAMGLPPGVTLSPADVAQAQAMGQSAARLDKVYGVKGWDMPFPSFGDSIFQDTGGFRTKLAEYGFGFSAWTVGMGAYNVLNVPRSGLGPSLQPGKGTSSQQYWGQSLSGMNVTNLYLTYDTSRYGVPDGQILIEGTGSISSWEPYTPNYLGLTGLSWYQTLFNKALEIKFGLVANSVEWIGTFVGGNIASPLGSAASIPFEMGISATPGTQPSARVTWHINDAIYNQTGVMRSQPINGPTQNTLLDNAYYNPTGFRLSVPNGGLLVMDEFGYKTTAFPGVHSTWVRAGVMYNDSAFFNYRTGGVTSGVTAGYLLADYQLFQTAPGSIFSAYRGFYLGGSAMLAPDQTLPFNQNFELRAYVMGPFDSRPMDQVSLVYDYNGVSKYARQYVDSYTPYTGRIAASSSSSITGLYTARLTPGVYWTIGVAYTDRPSMAYAKNEGHDFGVVSSLFANF